MMDGLKVIITGATGMVGEGVLLECLNDAKIKEVLLVNRRQYDLTHAKLRQLLMGDFTKARDQADALKGFDACFYCAGVSSVGMAEEKYHHITYETTLAFAKVLATQNPNMVFVYVSGANTDSTESGRSMWARVKGKTENALLRLPFRDAYNFRPGIIKPIPGQKNVGLLFKILALIFPVILPSFSLDLSQIGQAMINSVISGYEKKILEIKDIRALASR
ncbi:MAG: NAD-dependent epimerase/dehydratase family protein [Saprospiraceae bacterium]|nr:NAD-dependent epimerase/dehydratase family protein [Saprospiraceae bacterium]